MSIMGKLFGKKAAAPAPQIVWKCPRCTFWTQSVSAAGDCWCFWLPQQITNAIGRKGTPEELQQKCQAFGALWQKRQYVIAHGGGAGVLVRMDRPGPCDGYEAKECPICGTDVPTWQKAHLVCAKCGRNVEAVSSASQPIMTRCAACGPVDHVKGVKCEPLA